MSQLPLIPCYQSLAEVLSQVLMPDHDKFPFSVWLQHDCETVEEFDLQYSKDGRIVTCWVSEDLIQNVRSLRWRSNGLGHPSKIRILTERTRVVAQPRSDKGFMSTHSRPMISNPYIQQSINTEYSCPRAHCNECEAPATSTDGRILTIKVEVHMPSEMRPPQFAYGSLPLRKDNKEFSRCEGRTRSSSFPPGMRSRPPSHPYLSSRRPVSFFESPSFEIPKASAPTLGHPSSPFLTFYFRARPREVLRSSSLPFRKRTHSSFVLDCPQVASSTLRTKGSMYSRSESSSSTSEGSTKVDSGSPTIPILVLPNSSSAKVQENSIASFNSPRSCASLGTHGGNAETRPAKRSRGLALSLKMDVAVQTDVMSGSGADDRGREGQRRNSQIYEEDCEGDDDERDQLLVKAERSLLETHQMLLDLRRKMRKRKA